MALMTVAFAAMALTLQAAPGWWSSRGAVEYLDLGHTVNFDRPWLPGSRCEYGLVSLTYLDGPKLEWLEMNGDKIRFLWLVSITLAERDFKKAKELEALEAQFEKKGFHYIDPNRSSVV